MKNPKFWKCNAKLALLLILPLAGGCLQQASSSPEETAAVAKTDSQSAGFAPPATELEPASAEQPSGEDISDAPVKTISSETSAPPPNIRPTGATAEVIKLAESGVDENVMLTFVGNSTAAFSLSAEEIIYLNDIGVPGKVVAAMIQRDHMLKGAYTEPETPPRDVV